MCGIIGIFNDKEHKTKVAKGLELMKYRGRDSKGTYSFDNGSLGHCLHAIVSHVKQPVKGKGVLVFNGEIYNWKELAKKYKVKAENDTELLLSSLDKDGVEKTLSKLDGVYALAYLKGDNVYLARDLIGVKPLWYCENGFASEKKVLEKLGYIDISELNPRRIVVFNTKTKKTKTIQRKFFNTKPELKEDYKKIKHNIEELFKKAVKKRVSNKRFGILFSGGIDSVFIAAIAKSLGYDFTCYVCGFSRFAPDVVYAKEIAKKLKFKLKVIIIKDIKKYLERITKIIESSHAVKTGVALTLFGACEKAHKDGCKVIFSGLGSEQLFGGYTRQMHYFKSSKHFDINKEGMYHLLSIYERDTYRDDTISMSNELELRIPFLDSELVKYCLRVPSKYKISDEGDKLVLRDIAQKYVGDYAKRKKKAAQYGSFFDKAIMKLAKKNKKTKTDYLRSLYNKNLVLGALISGGKDSIYAIHAMLRQNYKVGCVIAVYSANESSYMFHTPNIELVELQAKAMGLPLIKVMSKGKKEEELKDLEKGIVLAMKKYQIKGIISGATYSDYQRSRIFKICESLGIKVFSPLWHVDLHAYMKDIFRRFSVIFSSIAADGLSEKWLGRKLDSEAFDDLVKLEEKFGMNIAGEGGEFETLVLDCPIFKKKIVITKEHNELEKKYIGWYVVDEAVLEEK